MKQVRIFLICTLLLLSVLLCGCQEQQIDRGKELKNVLDTCDSKWSQSFPTGMADFSQVADYIAGWEGNAGLEVTKQTDHYIVLTNPATKGQKKQPSLTIACDVDPQNLRDCEPVLSLAMTAVLGPMRHGRLRLIVTEGTDEAYIGAEKLSSKYLDCDHFIHLYNGGSSYVYTSGALHSVCHLSCKANRGKTDYKNAYRITLRMPDQADPYLFDQEHAFPNPVNVIGDLLASAQSSGRLFDIASFNSKAKEGCLPYKASAVIVIDDNNVEAFKQRFEASAEALQKKAGNLELSEEEDETSPEPFQYTMTETRLPKRVLNSSVSDNIVSLMYTLQTGIHLQNEENGAITAASYIRSISTKDGRFTLSLDLRSRDESSMEEMTGNYLITSGLCDVKYRDSKPEYLWKASDDSPLASWFTGTVNEEGADPTKLQTSICDTYYSKRSGLDLIDYRYDKDHRGDALQTLLDYMDTLKKK